MPKFSHYLLLLGLPLCALSQQSYAAEQEQFLCGGTQASTNELPKLDSNCPIGKGLWGTKPKRKDSSFWIQCGLLNEPMPLSRAKVLYQHISTHVWMKPEGKAIRCLIGPYDGYATAKKELAGIVSEKLYKDAFIREVRKGEKDTPATVAKPAAPVVKKTTPKKPAVIESKTKPVVKPAAPVVPVAEPVTKAAPDLKQTPVVTESGYFEVTIRRKTTLNGITYAVPYVMDEKVQFYMENDLAWNRLSYTQAVKSCQEQGMRLATKKEWTQLLNSGVMQKEKWPVYLPYWGSESKGLFITGKVNTLKGTSLLNVMCVK